MSREAELRKQLEDLLEKVITAIRSRNVPAIEHHLRVYEVAVSALEEETDAPHTPTTDEGEIVAAAKLYLRQQRGE